MGAPTRGQLLTGSEATGSHSTQKQEHEHRRHAQSERDTRDR